MITKKLAEFVANLEYKELPAEVVARSKDAVIDYLSAVIAGYKEGNILSRNIIQMVKNIGGKKESTVFGLGEKVPMINAALANGVLSHVVELDDGHRIALGHPGVTTITAALAAGEYLQASGRELVTAAVAGYDVFVRIASAINPSHLTLGFHTTGTCGAFSAAAAASKMFKLDDEQTANALGLAGIQGAGLMEVTEDGQMAKALHVGKAAQAGILAALLAKKGAEGPKTIIEGNKGFAKAMSDGCDFELILDDLGKEYKILSCYIKPYPSCRHTHAPIDAILALRREEDFSLEDIKEIVIKTYPAAISLTGHIFRPKTTAAAKFSIPYCVCAALVDGEVGLKQFKPDRLTAPEILKMTDKVKVEVDPATEKVNPRIRGAEVQILLKNGKPLKKRVDLPKGEPEHPLTSEELREKFEYCTEGIFENNKLNEIMNSINNIDEMDNINELINLLK